MNLLKNRKGLAQALTLLLSILLIAAQLTVFYLFFLNNYINPSKFAVKEIPQGIDDSQFLINFLRTPVGDKTFSDMIVSSYANNNYNELKGKISNFIILYYEENHFWELKIGAKSVDNFVIIQPIIRDKIYESSVDLPLYSKEAVEIVFSIYE